MPIARATATPTSGPAPLSVTLDGSGSTDADGTINTYNWDWNGGSATGAQANVVFPAGQYSVTLTVTDNQGATGSDIVAVSAIDTQLDSDGDGVPDITDNCPSTANGDQLDSDNDGTGNACDLTPNGPIGYTLEAECAEMGSNWAMGSKTTASNGSYVVYQGTSTRSAPPQDVPENRVRFTISNAEAGTYFLFGRVYAKNSTTDSYYIRINGGQWTTWNTQRGYQAFTWNKTANNPVVLVSGLNTIDFAFREAGAQLDKIHLNMSGELPSGLGDDASNCGDEPANQAPIANGTLSETTGTAPLSVTMDGRSSVDSDGTIVSYNWSWNGGSIDGALQTVVFDTPDTYAITLTVTDDDGAKGTKVFFLTANEPANAAPTAVADATPRAGAAPLLTVLDGSASSDSDGTIVSYAWNWNGGNATGATPQVTFPVGVYTVTLTVTDNGGLTDTDVVQVTASTDDSDSDGDGIVDAEDNCPTVPNPGQTLPVYYADADGDGYGDPRDSIVACEAPDGYVSNALDNCPDFASSDLTDTDGDGEGDVCDEDDDNDGNPDITDCEPLNDRVVFQKLFFRDSDGDGFGDQNDFIAACTAPAGYVRDFTDNCPKVYNPDQTDSDGNGIGDACDAVVGSDGNYWLEAECATLDSRWVTGSNATTSRGAYVGYNGPSRFTVPTAASPGSQLTTTIEVAEDGTYHLFFRMDAWRSSSNSFWVQIDDAPWVNFYKFVGGTELLTDGFQWVKVNDNGTDITFNLSAGEHVLRVANRESYSLLDKMVLSLSKSLPTGLGGEAINCAPSFTGTEPGSEMQALLPAAYLGTTDLLREPVIDLYPNPTMGNLNVQLTSDYVGRVELMILDINGRLLQEYQYEKADEILDNRLQVDDLPMGTYTVRIIEGDRQLIRKFIKLP